ncbi:thermonuclease family protein [Synechococcus sp. LTW-R]|nr:thermonuclease family protein [Synechococcus sp. LTW-R]
MSGTGQDRLLRRITIDRYRRTVGELFVGGTNVQQQMVRSG